MKLNERKMNSVERKKKLRHKEKEKVKTEREAKERN